MQESKSNLPQIYNPGNQTKEEIIRNFVVRNEEFQQIFNILKTDRMESLPQHFLIQGQRGYGKTTLLLRLFHEVNGDEEVKKWLIPIIFDEEQYNIRTLYKLWENIAAQLEEDYEDEFYGILDEMETAKKKDNYETKCYDILEKYLKAKKKKIVIFLDNVGDLIRKLSPDEVTRFTHVLSRGLDIRFICGSAEMLEANEDLKNFLVYFEVVQLKGLSSQEANYLLLKLGENYKSNVIKRLIETEPERIETLRRLTGGVPRTIVLLYEVFVDYESRDSIKDLEIILDRVTPLYKHRMDDLTPLQQEIVDTIAMSWDAVSFKEIIKKTNIEERIATEQINYLEKNKLVFRIIGNRSEVYYQLSERFFNIWYLMRYGRKKDRNKVLWIVRFLVNWCNEDEIVERAKKHIQELQEGKIKSKDALYITEALSNLSLPQELYTEMLEGTKYFLERVNSELLNDIPKSDKEIVEIVYSYLNQKKYRLALNKLLEVKNSNGFISGLLGFIYESGLQDIDNAHRHYLKAVEKGNTKAINNLAVLYENEYKDFEKAERFYLLAIEKGNVRSINNLGLLYYKKMKDYVKAQKYFELAIEKGFPFANINLGLLFQNEYKNFEKAEAYYLKAIAAGAKKAYYYLGSLYQNSFHDYRKAESFYQKAVEEGDMQAMYHLGFLYQNKLKEYDKAEECYKVSAGAGNPDAMNNLAIIYKNQYKDFVNAEKYYLEAVEKEHEIAMHNLALLYQHDLNRPDEAEKYYLMTLERGNFAAAYNLGVLYEDYLDDVINAEKYLMKASDKGHNSAMTRLAMLYFKLKKNKEIALMLSQKAFEYVRDHGNAMCYALMLLWHDQFDRFREISQEFIEIEKFMSGLNHDFENYLIYLMAFGKYDYVYELFEKNQHDVKDVYRPLYYALMFYMQDVYPDEFRRMGEELHQTVEEIVDKIQKLKEDYTLHKTA